MAEVLATMVVGPLVSMVKEKASSYLLEQYKVMEGLEEQHEVLKRKLPAILDVIADAEMQAAEHREGAKAWLEAVRKVAYQANDVFDEFKYEALRRKAKKEGHYRKLGMDVIKLFPTHNRIVFRYRMGNKLRLIMQEIEVLVAEMNAFRFKFRPQQQLSMKWRQTDSNIVDPTAIASRSRAVDKQKVVDTLLGQGNNVDLIVLPIVGMGGLGKTTLAQLIFNDSEIQKHFQLLLWLCVSDNFDVNFLAKSIVEEATNGKKNGSETSEKKNGSETSKNSIVEASVKEKKNDNLQEVLSGKRYLLVLDDVWNRDASQWEKLKSNLQHGGIGSSVLTTTRDEAIAQFMGTTKTYKLGFLDQSFIEEIIKTKAFGSKEESPDNDLGGMVGDIAKRCAGSPLAATALGSVLRTKTSVEEWKTVLSRSTICDDETEILPILKLSYNDLPSQMRQCFSFCAMFPKDYEIEVDMLIQLWMANGFILEQQGVCLEIRGKQIFTELASRSFFQDLKRIPLEFNALYGNQSDRREQGYYSRTTCKIHDLMHDVAQSAMGKECATITTKPRKGEDFPYSSRHLFVQLDDPEIILNGFPKEKASALQTLLCITAYEDKELHYLSKNNSIRALRIQGQSSFFFKPKYLHHLRYLDLSGSEIKSLPEDLSILYHLQTLNLSGCTSLAQLPKQMKYMTALRHLYTHGCWRLKMMPPELRCLSFLQTPTCFVAGTTGSSCSNLGELELLDLGGQLEVCRLENVTEKDARAANLENKKKLTELTLNWTDGNREPQHHYHKVLEGLKPHDGIKVLSIESYGGSTCPAWMNTLQHVVDLVLYDCSKVEKLPPLWRLEALQVLQISGMGNLQCLCGGDPPFTFKKLKWLRLYRMPNFETWWDINAVYEEKDPIFPVVEKLLISGCEKLSALPRASTITEISDAVVNTVCRSACPALKQLELRSLTTFQRWEAAEGTLGEQITTFPWLEELSITKCPELTTLPEAPKLNALSVGGNSQQIFLHGAARYITSLSRLGLFFNEREATLPIDHNLIELLDDKEKWNSESSPLRVISLIRCNFMFPAPALWNCFVQLEDLLIMDCDALVHWSENMFQRLVSLRKLDIMMCKNLTGQASEQREQSVLPPRLESLWLHGCESLVELPTLPASLKKLDVYLCDKLESVVLRKQQQNTSTRQEKPSTAVHFSSCSNLQSLSVHFVDCNKLSISKCSMLKSLDDDLPSLEHLQLFYCKSLESIPDRPQAYSSLKFLQIKSCPRLKVLPPSLKQRLNDIEETNLDDCYTGPAWKRVIRRHC